MSDALTKELVAEWLSVPVEELRRERARSTFEWVSEREREAVEAVIDRALSGLEEVKATESDPEWAISLLRQKDGQTRAR